MVTQSTATAFVLTQHIQSLLVSFLNTTLLVGNTSVQCAKRAFTQKMACVNVSHHISSHSANPGTTGCFMFDTELGSDQYDGLECPTCKTGYIKKNGLCELKVSCQKGKIDDNNVCVGSSFSFPDSKIAPRNTPIA